MYQSTYSKLCSLLSLIETTILKFLYPLKASVLSIYGLISTYLLYSPIFKVILTPIPKCLFLEFVFQDRILYFITLKSFSCFLFHFHTSELVLHFPSLHFTFRIDYLASLREFVNFKDSELFFVLDFDFSSLISHFLLLIYHWMIRFFTFLFLKSLKFQFFCSFHQVAF